MLVNLPIQEQIKQPKQRSYSHEFLPFTIIFFKTVPVYSRSVLIGTTYKYSWKSVAEYIFRSA